ncbi:unnamed protein product [Rhodiola kirilowii]
MTSSPRSMKMLSILAAPCLDVSIVANVFIGRVPTESVRQF